jgi:hypothetical protein
VHGRLCVPTEAAGNAFVVVGSDTVFEVKQLVSLLSVSAVLGQTYVLSPAAHKVPVF